MHIEALGVDKTIDIRWIESQMALVDIAPTSIVSISGADELNSVAVAVIDMADCPIHLPSTYVLAAIIERREAAMSLAILHNKVDLYNDLRISKAAKILVPDPSCLSQVKDLRPDLNIVIGHKDEHTHDAFIHYGEIVDDAEYKVFPLHPRDIVPPTSSGFVGVILKKELIELRKSIQGLHHKIHGQCSNIERGLYKSCLDADMSDIATHCTLDHNGNFHGYVAAVAEGKHIKANLSQSTAFEMDKALFRQLNK